MTKKTSIVLLCLVTVLVLFFGVFAFIPGGLEYGAAGEFYSAYDLVLRSTTFGDSVKATYQLKLDEGVEFKNVQNVLKQRLQKIYGYYSVEITEKDGTVVINLPKATPAKVTNKSESVNTVDSRILSSITSNGKLEILNSQYTGTNKPTYSEDLVVVSNDNMRSARTRGIAQSENTFYICQARLTKDGTALVKKAELAEGSSYWYAIDEEVIGPATYQNGQFQIYGSSKENSKLIASMVRYGTLGATLTSPEYEDVENSLGWIFSVVMAVVILAVFVFLAVRYKTLGIAGILSQLIAIVAFIYAIALIYISTFNIFAAIGVIVVYAFMTFFTVFTFERIRSRNAEKTFSAAVYHGFKSTDIISLIAHASLLVLGIILWVIPTAVTAPLGTVLVYGALLSFAATFGLNRLFAKCIVPFNEVSGKTGKAPVKK